MVPGLFRRDDPDSAVASQSQEHRPCHERGCQAAHAALECVYLDRRDRVCGTAWCAAHVVEVSGTPYCRRHAGVVRALPTLAPGTYPDLYNRAPSLLNWVAQEIEPQLREMVVARAQPGHVLQEDPAHLAFIQTATGRLRTWERTWKLFDHTGIHLWVALDVEEENDLEILLRVDGVPLGRFIPPWIINRRDGITPTKEVDLEQRRGFNDALVAAVRQHLAR